MSWQFVCWSNPYWYSYRKPVQRGYWMSFVPTVSRTIVNIGRSRGGADQSMSPSLGNNPCRWRVRPVWKYSL